MWGITERTYDDDIHFFSLFWRNARVLSHTQSFIHDAYEGASDRESTALMPFLLLLSVSECVSETRVKV